MDLPLLVSTVFKALPVGMKGTATFTRVTTGPFDSASDTRAADVTETTSAPCVAMGGSDKYENGILIRHIDQSMMVQAKGLKFDPEPGMKVTFGAESYTVILANNVNPTGLISAVWDVDAVLGG